MASREYGLDGLPTLPLLEQVHRLHHAISMGYPYRETQAWTTMPIADKRRLLQYIKESRDAAAVKAPPPAPKDTSGIAEDDDYDDEKPAPSAPTNAHDDGPAPMASPSRSNAPPDPTNDMYLNMIETRTPTGRRRWTIQDAPAPVCPCGQTHAAKTSCIVLNEIKLMMTTFGDGDYPCDATATYIQAKVKANFRAALGPLEQVELMGLIERFPNEAMYYGRWKDFRSTAKNPGADASSNAADDTITDEMVDEMDLIASYEDKETPTLEVYFTERIKFADVRTKTMESTTYLEFSKKRTTNFMSQSAPFLAWLDLPKCSRATLEFLNFIIYNRIGLYVEDAIRAKHSGQLVRLEAPLMVADIEVVEAKLFASTTSSAASPFVAAPPQPAKRKAEPALLVSPPAARLKRLR
ncbi:hypothetical protein SPRG_10209 [Saprolegnia parasitica CBS 223.65]|uniref:Uncharacterized protein n=1 Tax=Saprolegnia parasitica (strain CBS 223.65) TaxID=695850 RepID=A0A067CDU3_SAPPC|nr:hypothetical protein SPRG_10209 [Saprolegnia parasitica CBS 223.65]KDO24676.1 hypothetical protein SPRG_10209 [Saprolegnia parasitica CBS 223.65]|eukprot:XP_012204557.1 hypothetical protein SPRG_10209 [Saprolegnia parasitica CBS 223.65]